MAFIAGIVLFGGSLMALSLTGERRWGAVTPIGGVCFLVGWAALIVAALTAPFDLRAGAPGHGAAGRRLSDYFFCASSRAFWYSAMTFCARCVGNSS